MRFFRLLIQAGWVLGLGGAVAVRAAGEAPPSTLTELQSRLAARLAASRAPGAAWGIEVVSLASGKVWFATNASRLFVPASNTKLFTGALALDQLGTNHQAVTHLLTTAPLDSAGRLEGDLWIRGEGDSMLAGRYRGGGWSRGIEPVVEAVKKAGVKRIDGDLLADVSAFRGPSVGSGWNWEDLSGSDAPAVSPLTFNNNCVRISVSPGAAVGRLATIRVDPPWASVTSGAGDRPLVVVASRVTTIETNRETRLRWDITPGSPRITLAGSISVDSGVEVNEVPVTSPAAYFLRALREGLTATGIEVVGKLRVPAEEAEWDLGRGLPAWRAELGTVASPSLPVRLREMMKPSDNLHAQLLLLSVGAHVRPAAGTVRADTTEAAGIRALEAFLGGMGLRRTEFFFEEGSGLSRKNAATPHAVVTLLTRMHRHSANHEWIDSLPIGGVDGSLKSRFTQAPLKGNVRAKTGSLQHVAALSGYVTTVAGEPLAFSILVNEFLGETGASARREIDSLVELLGTTTVPSEAGGP